MRRPYTYLLTFLPDGRQYFGVKYGADADPETFWVEGGYFSSSKVVASLIEEHGANSFSASVHEVFSCPIEAHQKELDFLSKISPQKRPLWINQHFGGQKYFGHFKTEEHKAKISAANSKPKSGAALTAALANGKKGSEARRGTKDSAETLKKKRASALAYLERNPEEGTGRTPKEYLIEGKVFSGMKSICEKYGVTRQTVHNRMKSKKFEWSFL